MVTETPVREESGTAGQRGQVYGFLRRVFSREMDAGLLDWCRRQQDDGLWSGLGVDPETAFPPGEPGTLVEGLAEDFCRLFIVSGAAGSPHESVHAGGKGPEGRAILMSEPVSELKTLYREAGFELDPKENRMPDALDVELEFMERICAAEAAASERGDAEAADCARAFQRRMLDAHLGRWAPKYARGLAGFALTGFYRAMLGLLADFVEQEAGEFPDDGKSLAPLAEAGPLGRRAVPAGA